MQVVLHYSTASRSHAVATLYGCRRRRLNPGMTRLPEGSDPKIVEKVLRH